VRESVVVAKHVEGSNEKKIEVAAKIAIMMEETG
jgi:hypothetical protein